VQEGQPLILPPASDPTVARQAERPAAS